MSTIKVDKLQGRSGSTTGLTFSGANGTFGGTLAVTGVHTVGNNAVITSEGGAVTPNLVQGLCKAWSQTDFRNTPAHADSFNHSGITDTATGRLNLAFTSAMNNANFSISGMNSIVSTSTTYSSVLALEGKTTADVAVHSAYNNASDGAIFDPPFGSVQVHGDLA